MGSTVESLATAAVVATCNGRTLLEANLPSLLAQSTPFRRIVVVDNGSSDGSSEWLESLDCNPPIEVVRLEANRGFAAAMNCGVARALEDPEVRVIAVLNNDVRLASDWHQSALLAMSEIDSAAGPKTAEGLEVGSVATLMLQEQRPHLIDSAGIAFDSGRASNRWHGLAREHALGGEPIEAIWGASAVAALYTREMLSCVGGFDESLFAYQEDVDLALRARWAGFGCLLGTRALGWHLGHGSNRRFPLGGTRADFLNARNRFAIMASAQVEGEPFRPMLRSVFSDLIASFKEKRAAAVWAGSCRGLLRRRGWLEARRATHARLMHVRQRRADRRRTVTEHDPSTESVPLVTVITLTLNEQRMLPAMLESIPPGWGSVVADGGSRDATRRIAREYGSHVVDQDAESVAGALGNFDVARNAAAEAARSDWLLFLDADERLTPELVDEIENALRPEAPAASAFSMPRQNFFWGRPGRILGEDRQVRLVRKGEGHYAGHALHQPIRVSGPVEELQQPLIHLNVRTWRDVVRRLRRYVPHQARARARRPTLLDVVREPLFLFRHYYLVNQARKDGMRGLAMSVFYAVERGATLALAWVSV